MKSAMAHEVQRTVEEITIGVARSMQRRRERDAEMGFSEFEQEFQIEIGGTATTSPGFSEYTIEFDYHFAYAPGQRDSDLDAPEFWYGFESDADIMLSAHVRSWTKDPDNGLYIGAVVRVGVMSGGSVPYQGAVHLVFAGYAAPMESEADIE